MHALAVAALLLGVGAAQAQPARITIGYHPDARPFTYENEAGRPVGFAVELCQRVIAAAKADLGLASTEVSWVPVNAQTRLTLMREKKVQMLCGEPVTVAGRKAVSFSIPIFQGGVGALVRADAPPVLVAALGAPQGTASAIGEGHTFAVVAGTPTEQVLAERLGGFPLADVKVTAVKSYAQGVQAVLERKASAFFADQSVLRDALRRSPSFAELKVLERRLTVAPVAIAVPLGNERARLAVDRALSTLYRSAEFRDIYTKWFGEPDAEAAAFFRLSALPE